MTTTEMATNVGGLGLGGLYRDRIDPLGGSGGGAGA
jgi:hypothetical protein